MKNLLTAAAATMTAAVFLVGCADSEELEADVATPVETSADHLGRESNAPVHHNIDEWQGFVDQYDAQLNLDVIRDFNDDVQAVCLNAFDVQHNRDINAFDLVEITATVTFPRQRYEDEWTVDVFTAAIIDSWCSENYDGDLGEEFGVRI